MIYGKPWIGVLKEYISQIQNIFIIFVQRYSWLGATGACCGTEGYNPASQICCDGETYKKDSINSGCCYGKVYENKL